MIDLDAEKKRLEQVVEQAKAQLYAAQGVLAYIQHQIAQRDAVPPVESTS